MTSAINFFYISPSTVYIKRRFFKKPKAVIYFDGSFYADENMPLNERSLYLKNQVDAKM